MISVAFAVAAFLLASSSIEALAPLSLIFRVTGLLIVLGRILWRKRPTQRTPHPYFRRTLIVVGIGFTVFLMASEWAHERPVAFLVGLVSFLIVAAFTYVLINFYSTPDILNGVYLALMAVCIASLVSTQLTPEIAFEHSRLRGLLNNANILGFVAFGLGAVSLTAQRKVWVAVSGISVSLVCLFMSGSRASVLALAIFILGLAVGRFKRARIMLLLTVLSIGMAWFLAPNILSDSILLRSNDSRSVGFEIMDQAMNQSFWFGAGELPTETMVAGSPFAAGITGGFWGLVGLGLMYFGLLIGSARSYPWTISLVLAGIIHSLFESWMLSFTAPILLSFFVMLVGFLKLDGSAYSYDTQPVRQSERP